MLTKGRAPLSALEALILSRRGLIDYASLCSFILVVQILASSCYEARYRHRRSVAEGERGSVPRKEMLRTWLYTAFSLVLALVVLCLKFLFARYHVGIWQSEWFFLVVKSRAAANGPICCTRHWLYRDRHWNSVLPVLLVCCTSHGSWGFYIGGVGRRRFWWIGAGNGSAGSDTDQSEFDIQDYVSWCTNK